VKRDFLVSIIKRRRTLIDEFIFFIGMAVFIKLMLYNISIGTDISQMSINTIATFGSVLLLMSISFLLTGKNRVIYILIIDAAVTAIILWDLLCFRHFKSMANIRSISSAAKYLISESNLIELLYPTDILLIADFIVLIYTKKSSHNFNKNVVQKSPGVFMVLITAGCICTGYSINNLNNMQPGILDYLYSKVYIAQVVGNLNFHGIDAYRNFKLMLDENKLPSYSADEITRWFQNKNKSKSTTFHGVSRGKNVIMIQVESMSQFVIGRKINGYEITPNINRFIKESIYFDNFYDETGNGGTSDAEFMSNVSLYPVSKGAVYTDHASGQYYSMAGILKGKGYSTVAMEAEQPGFWNIDMMYRSLGFDAIMDEDDYYHDEDIGMGLGDGSFFVQSVDKLKNMKRPFYAFMVTLSSHYPCIIPDRYRNNIDVSPYRDTILGSYIESIHYTDMAIGKFLEELKKQNLMDDSIIAIYGDHSAPLKREDELFLKFMGFDGGKVDDYNWLEMQKVPMIFYFPGNYSCVNHSISGHVDTMPTILNILGVDSNTLPLMGNDLLNVDKGFAISRKKHFFVDDMYIYDLQRDSVYCKNDGKKFGLSRFDNILNIYSKYIANFVPCIFLIVSA